MDPAGGRIRPEFFYLVKISTCAVPLRRRVLLNDSMAPDDSGNPEAPFDPVSGGADFERFTRRLIGLARAHLDARLHHRIDPEDVVQSAYKSFFLRYGDADIVSQGVDRLWALLTMITLRKCADRVRYLKADCRDVAREARPRAADELDHWQEAIGHEPTPEHAAVLAETVEQILADLTPAERQVIELSLQGYSTQEVSERLGRAERSVRRLRQRLKQHLEKLRSDGGG
jgi:RNA polymerase sigma-70 factor (ECF subfamily)